jgi:hypothetical protein
LCKRYDFCVYLAGCFNLYESLRLNFQKVKGRKVQNQRQPLEEMVKNLPLEIQEEVRDFVEFLLEKRVRKPKAKLRLDWIGALRDLRDEYTSVDLQHNTLQWWGD